MSELKPCPFCGGHAMAQKEWHGQHGSVHWVHCIGCFNQTRRYVSTIDSDPEDKAIAAWNNRSDGWIPCSERLPEYTDTYNVFCNVGSPFGGFTSVRSYRFERIRGNEPKWCIPNMYEEVVTVTHWQPLPQPPKGEA